MLIVSAALGSWLGMQAMHESGHVLGAVLSGGRVARLVLHPLAISRTDLADNPHSLVVSWSGPVVGILLPLALWGMARALKVPGAFALRFFAGFCLIANGAYIALGAFDRVGDAGELLGHGAPIGSLWAFGLLAMPCGLGLWHRLGIHFGLGPAAGKVRHGVAYASLVIFILLAALGLAVGR